MLVLCHKLHICAYADKIFLVTGPLRRPLTPHWPTPKVEVGVRTAPVRIAGTRCIDAGSLAVLGLRHLSHSKVSVEIHFPMCVLLMATYQSVLLKVTFAK